MKLAFGAAIVALTTISLAQLTSSFSSDPGMYVDAGAGEPIRIIGQIAEFKRSGSLLVNDVTLGIKSRKENIQLLGPHAQIIVSSQPIFYFAPAKQEAEAGVTAGDLILIRLEEKPERRQFEVGARGLARASQGITLTHQIQLYRSEVKPGVYKLFVANPLAKGEYALYLSRGEGMAAYVYDFGVEENSPNAKSSPHSSESQSSVSNPTSTSREETNTVFPGPQLARRPSIGVSAEGNPNTRHDGVVLTTVTTGGPADEAGIRVGDVMLAINGHYLYTIEDLKEQVKTLVPGNRVIVRYQRRSNIVDSALIVGSE